MGLARDAAGLMLGLLSNLERKNLVVIIAEARGDVTHTASEHMLLLAAAGDEGTRWPVICVTM